MAAVDLLLQPDWMCDLTQTWSHGVTGDGRVFFINEEAQSTTWLHPISGEAISTGHRHTPDLPTGWEEGYTFEGARCFINHNERKVSCNHPVSGFPSQDNCIFVLSEQSKGPVNEKNCRPLGAMSETCKQPGSTEHPALCSTQQQHPHPALCSTQQQHPPHPALCSTQQQHPHPALCSTQQQQHPHPSLCSAQQHPVPCQPCHPAQCQPPPCPAQPGSPNTRPSRTSKKIHNFGKRSNSIRRNPGAPVMRSNWLYKQGQYGHEAVEEEVVRSVRSVSVLL